MGCVIIVNPFKAYCKRLFIQINRYKFYPTIYHFQAIDECISYIKAAFIA